MEIVQVAGEIMEKLKELEALRGKLSDASFSKAKAIAEYEKTIALTNLRLKNGVIKTWENQRVDSLPATIIPSTAKGICWSELYKKELAESEYKSLLTQIEVLQTVVNGLQSIFRNLNEI